LIQGWRADLFAHRAIRQIGRCAYLAWSMTVTTLVSSLHWQDSAGGQRRVDGSFAAEGNDRDDVLEAGVGPKHAVDLPGPAS